MEWYRKHAPVRSRVAGEAPSTNRSRTQKAKEGKREEKGKGLRDRSVVRQAAEVCIPNQLGSTSLFAAAYEHGYVARRGSSINSSWRLFGTADGSKPREFSWDRDLTTCRP